MSLAATVEAPAGRPWTLEGLMAARVLVAAGASLGAAANALGRRAGEVDAALWALVGRSPQEAVDRLNGFKPGPASRQEVLDALADGRPIEARYLARRLRSTEDQVVEVLRELADEGLVDAQDPPEPCGDRDLGWFLVRRAAR